MITAWITLPRQALGSACRSIKRLSKVRPLATASQPLDKNAHFRTVDIQNSAAQYLMMEDGSKFTTAYHMLKQLSARNDQNSGTEDVFRLAITRLANADGHHQQALELLQLGATGKFKNQSKFGSFGLGLMHLHGRGVDQNIAAAIDYFEEAVRQGHTLSNFYLGLIHESAMNMPRAVQYYEAAAAGKTNNASALTRLGFYYRSLGQHQKGIAYFTAAAPENSLALRTLAALTDRGEHLETYKPATGYLDLIWTSVPTHKTLLRQAFEVSPNEPLLFGTIDVNSKTRAEDIENRFRFTMESSRAGSLEATFVLAALFEYGLVSPSCRAFMVEQLHEDHNLQQQQHPESEKQDFSEPSNHDIMLNLYFECCSQNMPEGIAKVAVLANRENDLTGWNLAREMIEALLETDRKVIAQFNYGVYCLHGRGGVDMDLAAAANWFRLAADAGLPEAEYNLGVMYERGEGVETDLKEAKSLFERAAEAGLVDAVEKLKVFV